MADDTAQIEDVHWERPQPKKNYGYDEHPDAPKWEQEYSTLKSKIDSYTEGILDAFIKSNYNLIKKTLGQHVAGKDLTHSTDLYSLYMERTPNTEIEIGWVYCRDCGITLFKSVRGYHHKLNQCYLWEIMRHGKRA